MRRILRSAARPSRVALLALLSLAATHALATTRTWPGAAPCDTTLQACLDGATNNDVVQVQSNGPIDEALNIAKPLTLAGAPGYRPVLAAGRSIKAIYDPGVGVDWSLTVERFTLLDGIVSILAISGNPTVTLRGLDITTATVPTSGYWAIYVSSYGSGTLHYEIAGNRSRLQTGNNIGAIFVDGNASTGRIHDNRVSATAAAPDGGIGVRSYSAASNGVIYANRLSGNIAGAIDITLANAYTLTAVDNAIACSATSNTAGIRVSSPVGLVANVYNNTAVGCGAGVSLAATNNSILSGRLANNLVAYNSGPGIAIFSTNMAGFSNDHNLVFGNGSNNWTPGTGTITSDPLLVRGIANARLAAGSPAIDAADSAAVATLLANASLPQIDADGSRRFKGATNLADIGAYEFGDVALAATVTVANGGVIDSPLLNGNGNALPQLMQNENIDTYVASAFDSGVTALNYLLARFGTVDEADGTAPTPGSSYDVFIPAPGDGAFLHTTAPGSQAGFATLIDNPYTNAHGERIVLATHRATPLFNHPLGVVFAFDVWFIAQLDAQGGDPAFPNGLAFHVYAQDPSLNAFVWTAPDAGTATAIDHVLLNGEPCGRLHVANGNLNPHPVDVVYEQNRWTITNTDGGAMPAGAQFNVVVDEAAIEFCRYDHIFHDGVGG